MKATAVRKNSKGRAPNKPSRPKPKATPPTPQKASLSSGALWKSFWAYGGPILALVAAYVTWTPSLTVTTGVNLDPSQTMQTQFVVTNTGHVPVYNVIFACALHGPTAGLGTLTLDNAGMKDIKVLRPGAAVSRGCVKESKDVFGATLKAEAFYKWPLIGMRDKVEGYFTVRRGTSGFFLVPDEPSTEFPPDPPSLIPR